jgi:hypothetical protein
MLGSATLALGLAALLASALPALGNKEARRLEASLDAAASLFGEIAEASPE